MEFKQIWYVQDYKRMIKLHSPQIGLIYREATIFWIIRICVKHGVQVQSNFDEHPPKIERTSVSNYLITSNINDARSIDRQNCH